ncbi:MAG: SUMF1/EgtB/PvdO family nonheme iron enzyme [Candidatus Aphodosoma sp.]
MGSNRVNRGGSWNNTAGNCRVANRNNNSPGNRNNNLGFRVVLLRSLRQRWMSCNKQILLLS